jgi:hypothetical protein
VPVGGAYICNNMRYMHLCIFLHILAYKMHIFLHICCIYDLRKVHVLHLYCIYAAYLLHVCCIFAAFLLHNPLHPSMSPGEPPAPLDLSRSNHTASSLGTTMPPAPSKVSSVNTEQWSVIVVTYIQHMQTNCHTQEAAKNCFKATWTKNKEGRLHY